MKVGKSMRWRKPVSMNSGMRFAGRRRGRGLPLDWGGGFYPPGVTQEDIINRLLMHGISSESGDEVPVGVIPSGSVHGLWNSNPAWATHPDWGLGLAPVGLDSMTHQPSH